jgi:hypothetical protein
VAVVVAGTLLGHIVGPISAPADVESDTNAATMFTCNAHVDATNTNAGFLTFPITSALLATLTAGPCSITISQGAGNLSAVTVTV